MKVRGMCVLTLTLGLVVSTGAVAPGSVSAVAPPSDVSASESSLSNGEVIDGEYIVVLQPSSGTVSWLDSFNKKDLSARITAVMAQATPEDQVISELAIIDGFAAKLSPASAQLLAGLPGVVSVSPNKAVKLDGASSPSATVAAAAGARVQTNPIWGLDRIDQESLPLDNLFAASNAGAGTHIYVVDSGIAGNHVEFGNGLGKGNGYVTPDDNPACFAHGTRVAATAGGVTVGVAKQATLHSVRVLDCDNSGSLVTALQGFDWIAKNVQFPAVVNMSFQTPTSAELNAAVDHLALLGVVPVAAAGDASGDACSYSPASATSALTVSATDAADASAASGNTGTCVDIYAPGVDISSASSLDPNSYVRDSGTSMAAPHVAGIAATYLADYPNATPDQVKAAITTGAAVDKVTGVQASTPNRLANLQRLPVPVTIGGTYPAPVISAFNPVVAFGSETVIDGSGSSSASGSRLLYQWRVDDQSIVLATSSFFRFEATKAGWHIIRLTVIDGSTSSTTYSKIFVSGPNESLPPVADFTPGVNRKITIGSRLYFDGGTSTDPDGGDLTYAWRTTGVDGVASSRSSYARTFDEAGVFDVELTVTDDEGQSATKKIEVSVIAPPVVLFTPGEDFEIVQGESVTFDASDSYDPDGGFLLYEWSLTGSGIVSRTVSFTNKFDKVGRYAVELYLVDDDGQVGRKRIVVTVRAALPPIIKLDPATDQRISAGQTINFNADGSYDPDGGDVTYEWYVDGAGPVERTPQFSRAFSDVGNHTVELRVTDNEGAQVTKTINVVVGAPVPPIADFKPGADQEILTGKSIAFNGSASNDPDGGSVTYSWTSTGSSEVSTAATYSPTFAAPGTFDVKLTVTDDEGVAASKTIKVVVRDPALPIADFAPGETRRVSLGQRFTFDGSASNDPDGGTLRYEWRSTYVPVVGSTTSSYSRTFDKLGRIGVELTVIDDEGQRAKKHVNFWVYDPVPPIATFTPGVDQYVKVGASLSFDGSASNDPDGGALIYEWRTTGVNVIVSKTDSYSRSFDKPGRVGIELTVIDDEGRRAKKHINVWVSA